MGVLLRYVLSSVSDFALASLPDTPHRRAAPSHIVQAPEIESSQINKCNLLHCCTVKLAAGHIYVVSRALPDLQPPSTRYNQFRQAFGILKACLCCRRSLSTQLHGQQTYLHEERGGARVFPHTVAFQRPLPVSNKGESCLTTFICSSI